MPRRPTQPAERAKVREFDDSSELSLLAANGLAAPETLGAALTAEARKEVVTVVLATTTETLSSEEDAVALLEDGLVVLRPRFSKYRWLEMSADVVCSVAVWLDGADDKAGPSSSSESVVVLPVGGALAAHVAYGLLGWDAMVTPEMVPMTWLVKSPGKSSRMRQRCGGYSHGSLLPVQVPWRNALAL
jgi:hypothetical protein